MPLTRDEVLAGAMHLLDEIGLDELTMRRLAHKLKVQAGAIYWHFANKQALFDAMVDELTAGVLDEPLEGPWDEQLATLCRRLAAGFLSHRDGAKLATMAVEPGANGLAVSEMMLRIASSAGFTRERTLWATAVLGYYVLGYVTDLQAMLAASARGLTATLKSLKKQLASKKYPTLARLGDDGLEELITQKAFQQRFEFGLAIILDGLKSYRRRARTKRR